MKKVEKWIPDAIEVIAANQFAEKGGLKIDAAFKGYFASFGAAIIQSGLLPAVIFFENEQGGAKADRYKVPQAILHLLKKQYGSEQNKTLHEYGKLSEYVLNSKQAGVKDLQMISKAAVALKIALRTFDLTEEKLPA